MANYGEYRAVHMDTHQTCCGAEHHTHQTIEAALRCGDRQWGENWGGMIIGTMAELVDYEDQRAKGMTWTERQKQIYLAGRMSMDRQKHLESIPGWTWTPATSPLPESRGIMQIEASLLVEIGLLGQSVSASSATPEQQRQMESQMQGITKLATLLEFAHDDRRPIEQ